MSQVSQAITDIRASLPEGVSLLAVSKTHPVSLIEEAYGVGQRDFGENKVQEMVEKAPQLPGDIRWHLIGHLQTNKVKYIAPFVYLIHSVDTPKLLGVIDKEGRKVGRVIDCLLQVHVAQEETKFGFSPDELVDFMKSGQVAALHNVRIRGLMAMASNTPDMLRVNADFVRAHDIFCDLRDNYFHGSSDFSVLSMGMSGDYKIAVSNGANIVRIGSLIFGQRVYSQNK